MSDNTLFLIAFLIIALSPAIGAVCAFVGIKLSERRK